MMRPPFARGDKDAYEFALAERLGLPLSLLRRTMGARELAEWMAFDRYREALRKRERAKAELQGKARRRRRR